MNSLVWPHIHTYPEDTRLRLEEARQATKWKDEVDGMISAPMVQTEHGKDYFTEEPCLANVDEFGFVGLIMPVRWFK